MHPLRPVAVHARHPRAGRPDQQLDPRSLRVDDELILSGPYGSFVDDPISTAPGLFLAAGSGLAPIRSLIEAGLAAGTRASLTLIFSARSEAEVIDRERIA